MAKQPIIFIFTDLDGTLLSHDTYSFKPALVALKLIRSRGIPLVLCSSKTRVEIEYWRRRLENHHPSITENGGAIFHPHAYFSPAHLMGVRPKAETRENAKGR